MSDYGHSALLAATCANYCGSDKIPAFLDSKGRQVCGDCASD